MLQMKLLLMSQNNYFIILVADTCAATRFLETVGFYNNKNILDSKGIKLNVERFKYWLQKGACVKKLNMQVIEKII